MDNLDRVTSKPARVTYRKPSLKRFGSIVELTQAKECGGGTPDGGMCNGTPGNVKYS